MWSVEKILFDDLVFHILSSIDIFQYGRYKRMLVFFDSNLQQLGYHFSGSTLGYFSDFKEICIAHHVWQGEFKIKTRKVSYNTVDQQK